MKSPELSRLRTFLPKEVKISIVSELFPSRLAVMCKCQVVALNSLFVESPFFALEDYVLEVIDYFGIKVSLESPNKLSTLIQLTLF